MLIALFEIFPVRKTSAPHEWIWLDASIWLFSIAKMVLKDKYINYEDAKIVLNMDSLEEQRHILCLKFATQKNGIKTNNLNDLCLKMTKYAK